MAHSRSTFSSSQHTFASGGHIDSLMEAKSTTVPAKMLNLLQFVQANHIIPHQMNLLLDGTALDRGGHALFPVF
jgi:hypothetical protein